MGSLLGWGSETPPLTLFRGQACTAVALFVFLLQILPILLLHVRTSRNWFARWIGESTDLDVAMLGFSVRSKRGKDGSLGVMAPSLDGCQEEEACWLLECKEKQLGLR